jgi:hypothetical protein
MYIMNLRRFVLTNKLNISIFIFLIVFYLIHLCKPGLMYNQDGSFRQFGIGYRNKTILPIWIIAVVVAIFSYLAVLYYVYVL